MQHQHEDDLTNTMAAQTAAATAAAGSSSRKRLADDSSVASMASIASGRSSKRSIRRQDSLTSVESAFSLGIDDLVHNLEGIDVNYSSNNNHNNNHNQTSITGGMDLLYGSLRDNNNNHSHNHNTSISNNSFSNSFSSAGRNNDSAASRLSSGMWSFSDLEPWNCQMCTFENEAIFTACEMCGHCKQTHSSSSKANATFAATATKNAAPRNKPSVVEESRAAQEAENIRLLQEERLRQLAQYNQPPRGLSASPPLASVEAAVPLAAASKPPPLPSTTTTTNTSPRPPRNPTNNAKPNLVAKRCVSPKRNSLFSNTHNAMANASTTIPCVGEEAPLGNASTSMPPSPPPASTNTNNDDDNFDDASFPNLNQLQWQQPLNASPRRYSPPSTNVLLAGAAGHNNKVDPQDSADTATTFDMSSSSVFGGYYPTTTTTTDLPVLHGSRAKQQRLRASSSSPSSSSTSSSKKKASDSHRSDGKPSVRRFIDV